MGWASGGIVFDVVATALIQHDASDELTTAVLRPLIRALRDGDWDTIDESEETFRDDPLIACLLRQATGTDMDGDQAEGQIEYEDGPGEWRLECSRHGVLGYGDGAAEEHDRLVQLWFAPEAENHGGAGRIEAHWLIGGAA